MTGGLTNRRFWRADTAESRERGRGDRGFSFVDVMATVAVTGVLMAIAIPSIGTSLVDMRSNAGMRALQGHLRTARDSAVAQRRIVEVQFIGTNEVRSTRLEGTDRQTLQTTIFENGMRFHVMAGVPDTPDAIRYVASRQLWRPHHRVLPARRKPDRRAGPAHQRDRVPGQSRSGVVGAGP